MIDSDLSKEIITLLCDEVVRVYFRDGNLGIALKVVKNMYLTYKKMPSHYIEMDKAN